MKNKNLNLVTALFLLGVMLFSAQLVAQKTNDSKVVKIQTNLDCHSCKLKIEKYMAFEKGVTSVVADVPSKMVTLGYRSARTNEENLCKAIEKLGYTATVIKDEEKQPEQKKN